MENIERRQSPRINPPGLKAVITTDPPHNPPILEGEVMDMSHSGIKIRLSTPQNSELQGKIRIQLFLPESGIPLSITGILKHQHQSGEMGIHYTETNSDAIDELDKFIFECTKMSRVS